MKTKVALIFGIIIITLSAYAQKEHYKEVIDRYVSELKLSNKQASQFTEIFKKYRNLKREQSDGQNTVSSVKERYPELREKKHDEIKAILTTEQYVNFLKLEQEIKAETLTK